MTSLSLKTLAIWGAIWTIASYGMGQILRFGSNLILTHLLFPDLFGLMTLVNVFIMGLQLFSDVGIAPNIIQSKRGDDPAFLNTAWTIQVIRGFALWLGAALLAVPVAQFYQEPRLLWLLPIVSLTTIISGFNSTALITCDRHLAIRQLAIFEFVGQAISLSVMVVWAAMSPTIWALVAGTLISALIRMVWSHQILPGVKNRLLWDRSAVQEIVSFGRWIFISTALTFLAGQADRLILGRIFSLDTLGVYVIAFTLSDVPRQVVLAVSGKVIFPAVSKLAELPRPEFRATILRSRKPVLLGLAIALALMVAFGDLAIRILYNAHYQQAAWMFPLLAAGLWFNMLSQTLDPALFAIGQPQAVALGNLLRFLLTAIGIPLGFAMAGIPGAVVVVALNDVPFYGAITYGLWREKLLGFQQDLQATGVFVVVLGILLVMRSLSGFGSPLQGLM